MDMDDKQDDKIIIIVENQEITCNKSVLVEFSDYFRAMFDSSMIECQTNKVTLHEQSYEAVAALIRFMNTGELDFHPKTAYRLLETAVMLQISKAIESCCSYFLHFLNDCNCLHVLKLSKSLSLDVLYNPAKRHALYYFNNVSKTKTFCELSLEELMEYLCNKNIKCASELDIINAIYRWYIHDTQQRGGNLPEALGCVHCEDMYPEDWTELEDHEIVKKTDAGKTWYQEVLNRRAPKNQLHEKFREVPVCFLNFGGTDPSSKEVPADIYKFEEKEKQFKQFKSLSHIYEKVGPRVGFDATVVGKDLYFTGGQPDLTRGKFFTEVWKLDGFDFTWHQVTSLPIPRRHHGSCGSDTELFLVGGFGRFRDILDSFQKYDTVAGDWEDLPALPVQCFSPQAFYSAECVYMIKQDIWCYNCHTKSWCKLDIPTHTGVMNYLPKVHRGCLYMFPMRDVELNDIDGEEELAGALITKLDLKSKELEVTVHDDRFQFGGKIAMCNGKIYMFNQVDRKFVWGYIDSMTSVNVIGSIDKSHVQGFLIALPHYPKYSCSDDNLKK